jgi:hypothetical protein
MQTLAHNATVSVLSATAALVISALFTAALSAAPSFVLPAPLDPLGAGRLIAFLLFGALMPRLLKTQVPLFWAIVAPLALTVCLLSRDPELLSLACERGIETCVYVALSDLMPVLA